MSSRFPIEALNMTEFHLISTFHKRFHYTNFTVSLLQGTFMSNQIEKI